MGTRAVDDTSSGIFALLFFLLLGTSFVLETRNMKHYIIFIFVLLVFLPLNSCNHPSVCPPKTIALDSEPTNTTNYVAPDGRVFQYKITLTGRMPKAKYDTSITVYTNDASITYIDVMASVYSSDDSAVRMNEKCYIDWSTSVIHN